MILEGIMTTLGPRGEVNISPMGPEVDASMESLVLKPFKTSITYRNLKRTGEGVFQITDDVELLAQAAIGQPEPLPKMTDATSVHGKILADCCRWYAVRVKSLDDAQERTRIVVRVVEHGWIRDFFGFNRAKHAVVEAAILATRTRLLPIDEIRAQFERLRVLVEKTGGDQERRAFEFLEKHISAVATSEQT